MLLMQSWIRYVIDDNQYELPIITRFIIFFIWFDKITDNVLIWVISFLYIVFVVVFYLVVVFHEIWSDGNVILLAPYTYSDYIAKPAIIIGSFLLFTKLCRISYIKYQDISNKIDKISDKVFQ